jgi:putative methyltransferase (TIGR01177 family)
LKSKTLVLLSGEGTTIPAAEARALFLTYDPKSTFECPEPRVLVANSAADPNKVGSRIAFARRVGILVTASVEASSLLRGRKIRFRYFDLKARDDKPDPGRYLDGIDATVDLQNPDYEMTLVRGVEDYLAVTAPGGMQQAWSTRRPRRRPFFHPSAIFPKLSRALVNLSRVKEGDVLLDPFAGTGSIAIEASLTGAKVAGVDLSEKMVLGALSNMKHFYQEWLGVIRADSIHLPLRRIGAVATDIPYGRASSTQGREPRDILRQLLPAIAAVMSTDSFAVLMHPREVSVGRTFEFSVEEEHDLHIHKLLTRTITILRRR